MKSDIKAMPWFAIIVVILIFVQAFVLFYFMHIDDDDSFYVGAATTTMQTNSLFHYDAHTGEATNILPMRYVLSPWPIFCAALSGLTGINVTILMHTVLPVILIPLTYLVYYLIAVQLFENNKRAVCLFLVIACAVNIFGYASIYTQSTFLLFRIWQGKAILANIILPLILLAALRVLQKDGTKADWILLFSVMLAACMVSSMGIALAPLMLMIFALVFTIVRKIWNLLLRSAVCCIPCVLYGIIYLLLV